MALKAAENILERKPAIYSIIQLHFFFRFHGNHKIVFVFQIKHVSEQRVHYSAVLNTTTYHCSNLIRTICYIFFPLIFETHHRKAASRHLILGQSTERKICQKL